MAPPNADLLLILRTLSEHGVDSIVVGGVCGVLHGAPVSTFDLDLVHSREPGNVTRLLAALKKLDARYRDPGGRVLRPAESHLLLPGHQLLLTSGGPLDMLGEIGNHHGYRELLPDTVMIALPDGLRVRTLTLEALIREKTELGRDKDRATLAILRRTLEEKGG